MSLGWLYLRNKQSRSRSSRIPYGSEDIHLSQSHERMDWVQCAPKRLVEDVAYSSTSAPEMFAFKAVRAKKLKI